MTTCTKIKKSNNNLQTWCQQFIVWRVPGKLEQGQSLHHSPAGSSLRQTPLDWGGRPLLRIFHSIQSMKQPRSDSWETQRIDIFAWAQQGIDFNNVHESCAKVDTLKHILCLLPQTGDCNKNAYSQKDIYLKFKKHCPWLQVKDAFESKHPPDHYI